MHFDKEPIIECPSFILQLLDRIAPEHIVWAYSSGVSYQDGDDELGDTIQLDPENYKPPDLFGLKREIRDQPPTKMRLTKYLRSTAVIVRILIPKSNSDAPILALGKSPPPDIATTKTILVSREEVIKYVANKLGGAHYDVSRKNDAQRALDLFANHRIGHPKGPKGQQGGTIPNRVVLHILQGIGQDIIRSDDVQTLVSRIEQEASRE